MVSDMVRSLLTSAAVAWTAVLSSCTGQNIQGAWIGPVPFEGGEDCRTELHPGGYFKFVCSGPAAATGAGHYMREGNDLILDVEWLALEGKKVLRPPAAQKLRVTGGGNTMSLRTAAGGTLVWKRAANRE
jgi:hypothetical protein